ncbi:phage tail protein [Amycolatopsis pigmentata]|uniref:Phage tail protein n=1 Tax=Amycolatopsis pigmentata TaxID=450801 RepID=A0ABW5FP41_9PSEU
MSRNALPDLPSRHPLGERLPGLYATDGFTQRFVAGLDTVLAPVLSTLDNLPAYLDPRLTPEDFLPWLASWVAADFGPDWPAELRRRAVALAVELHRWKGTRRGLADRLWVYLGVRVRVLDGAGATWSNRPGSALPGEALEEAVVQVWPGVPGRPVDPDRVAALVAEACPIHLTCRVEVLSGPPPEEGS